MPVRVAMIVAVVALALSAVASVAAQEPPLPRTPGGAGNDAASAIDLAALMLVPDDLDIEGTVFGYESGRYTTVDDKAGTIVSLANGDAGDVRDELLQAGWMQGYYVRIASPSGDDPSLTGVLVYSGISRYESEAGANIGFRLLSDAYAESGYITARGTQTIGDESAVTRNRVTSADRRTSQVLNAIVRTGPFVVHVFVVDYADEPSPIELAAELSEILMERIQSSALESGLSNRALVLTGDGLQTTWALYRRIEGDQIAQYRQSPADVRADDEFYDAAGAETRFHTRQWAAIPGNEDDYVDFTFLINEFEDEEAADITLEAWADGEIESPPAGYVDINVAPEFAEFGDESRVHAFSYDRGETGVTSGFRYFIRLGSVLVIFSIDSLAGADQAAVESIAAAAAECVAAADECQPMELPASLMDDGGLGEGADRA